MESITSPTVDVDEDDVSRETLLVSDGTSAQLRHIMHRNSRERAAGERHAKTLENQRKSKEVTAYYCSIKKLFIK